MLYIEKIIDPKFQSTLPRGRDDRLDSLGDYQYISIHAPSRERLLVQRYGGARNRFQSTLPRGSDYGANDWRWEQMNFNPRSLAGATMRREMDRILAFISIHAPSRERRRMAWGYIDYSHFNPRSLAGATLLRPFLNRLHYHFNPRSLAGATTSK